MSEPLPAEPQSEGERRFREAMKQILSVPKDEILRRELEAKGEKKPKKAA